MLGGLQSEACGALRNSPPARPERRTIGTSPRMEGVTRCKWSGLGGDVVSDPDGVDYSSLPPPPAPRRPLWNDPSSSRWRRLALWVVGLELLWFVFSWLAWRSLTFDSSGERVWGWANYFFDSPTTALPAVLCLVVTVIVVRAYRHRNATRSLYLFALIVAGVAILGGAALAATSPPTVCQYCVSGCDTNSLNMFGPDPDGPSHYAPRACDVQGYLDLPSDHENATAWINRYSYFALGTVALGLSTALLTGALWFRDRQRLLVPLPPPV